MSQFSDKSFRSFSSLPLTPSGFICTHNTNTLSSDMCVFVSVIRALRNVWKAMLPLTSAWKSGKWELQGSHVISVIHSTCLQCRLITAPVHALLHLPIHTSACTVCMAARFPGARERFDIHTYRCVCSLCSVCVCVSFHHVSVKVLTHAHLKVCVDRKQQQQQFVSMSTVLLLQASCSACKKKSDWRNYGNYMSDFLMSHVRQMTIGWV